MRKLQLDLTQPRRGNLAWKKGDNSSQKAHHRSPQLSQSPTMSYPSLAPFVLKRPWLTKMMMPLANFYVKAAGYRELGLRCVFPAPPLSPRCCARREGGGERRVTDLPISSDDLLPEDNEVVLAALKRLPPKESYDRVYRIRRATQLSLQHKVLPKSQWTKDEEDTPYLMPLVKQIEAELKEQDQLDSMEVVRKH